MKIALIARTLATGRDIALRTIPGYEDMEIRRSTYRICTNEDQLRGLELSGLIILEWPRDKNLVLSATHRLRVPMQGTGSEKRKNALTSTESQTETPAH